MGPNYFAVIDFVPISPEEFDLPRLGSTLYLVSFATRDLGNPETDPIGVYFYSGMRRFIWRDKFWSEYELPYRPVMERIAEKLRDCIDKDEAIRLRRWLDELKNYSKSQGPTGQDMIDNPLTQGKTFHRVIYEINNA